jgi:hypothetical protein
MLRLIRTSTLTSLHADRNALQTARTETAFEQQTTNAHLASIADSLARIADAMNQTSLPPEPEPKRPLWLHDNT